ncbi:hypothetical protein V5799_007943 [Amblyomma americanum]|uniref:EB domain-containing protein n=1 Tax=Amblyomma americanum TaxID=6943 RepID=A0AAQ4FG52_AMBAM
MRRLLAALLTAALSTVGGAQEPREWYRGNMSRVPDYRLVARQSLNTVDKPLLFACSAAAQEAVLFHWRVEHPDGVSVSYGPRARSLSVHIGGRELYVRDSLLRLWSPSPHDGSVHCTVLGPGGREARARMSANYSTVSSVSAESCAVFCRQERTRCVLDGADGLDCRCVESFPRRDPFHGVCFAPAKLGRSCVFDHECEPKGSWCQGGVCACRPPYAPSGPLCEPVARLGEPCPPARCAGPCAECRDGRCACDKGCDDVDGVCVAAAAAAPKVAGRRPAPVFGPMNMDGSTVLMLVVFCVLLGLITLYHTLMDFRYRLRR